MTALIISCISLLLAIIALIRTFKKKENFEFLIQDDLTGLKDIKVECRGVRIRKPEGNNLNRVREGELGNKRNITSDRPNIGNCSQKRNRKPPSPPPLRTIKGEVKK